MFKVRVIYGCGCFSFMLTDNDNAYAKFIIDSLSSVSDKYMLLTASLPKDSELENLLDGSFYSVIRRGGFSFSQNAEAMVIVSDISICSKLKAVAHCTLHIHIVLSFTKTNRLSAPLREILAALVAFAEFNGVGVKNALGMGKTAVVLH